ncbi:putative transcriptional regulator, MarR family protein [Pseudonocardia sulfidoxydans NBRC 16205]|uniref:Putative transcriptional regulator, MarR family protein n=1 Tax=Pseudonocardia sulfidoxydans NBRC 16205 TaxID=1223511 RepID=A0A511DJ56_9PSEU|nr:MarR family transcriptional regulator [Pseudonocardia sulfidoxydans]GEL24846.1 putative transcriptional regulator, MarR family protein [Pseudonocardia sulfidoxydans NBRC 16205]
MTESGLLLDDQLCFALYSASRAITGCYRAALSATGLTYSQYIVMLVLWEHDRTAAGDQAPGLSLRDLGERLSLDNGTLSPLVKRLAQLGLVTRQRSLADERVLLVACTPAGRDLYQDAVAAQASVVEATGMTADSADELRAALDALTARLRDHTPPGPAVADPAVADPAVAEHTAADRTG